MFLVVLEGRKTLVSFHEEKWWLFGSFGYAKMSLYDRNLSLVLLLVLLLLALLASVSVDSLPSNFQDGCL